MLVSCAVAEISGASPEIDYCRSVIDDPQSSPHQKALAKLTLARLPWADMEHPLSSVLRCNADSPQTFLENAKLYHAWATDETLDYSVRISAKNHYLAALLFSRNIPELSRDPFFKRAEEAIAAIGHEIINDPKSSPVQKNNARLFLAFYWSNFPFFEKPKDRTKALQFFEQIVDTQQEESSPYAALLLAEMLLQASFKNALIPTEKLTSDAATTALSLYDYYVREVITECQPLDYIAKIRFVQLCLARPHLTTWYNKGMGMCKAMAPHELITARSEYQNIAALLLAREALHTNPAGKDACIKLYKKEIDDEFTSSADKKELKAQLKKIKKGSS